MRTRVDVKATVASNVEMGSVARHLARVAAKLFADRGYDATSVREIVDAQAHRQDG
jgi:AcrR family transcriptional regulator